MSQTYFLSVSSKCACSITVYSSFASVDMRAEADELEFTDLAILFFKPGRRM